MSFTKFLPYLVLCCTAWGVVHFIPDAAPTRDFMALWLAAQHVAAGDFSQIYAAPSHLFTMRPPEGWYAEAAALGRPGAVYPYLYPPIWIWLLAPITTWASFEMAASVVYALNIGGLLAIAILAMRFAYPGDGIYSVNGGSKRYLATALIFMVLSGVASTALSQGQPQILVATLVVLALERSGSDHPTQAGLALGMAIALKLAPLPIAIIFLLSRQVRAGVIALAFAAGWAILSLIVCGFETNMAFVDSLRTVSRTVFLTSNTYSFDSVLAKLWLAPSMTYVPALPDWAPGERYFGDGWLIGERPASVDFALTLIRVAVVLAGALFLRRAASAQERALGWSIVLAAIAFVGPIGWLYYYIPTLAFAPLVLKRLSSHGKSLAWIALFMLSPFGGVLRPYLPQLGAGNLQTIGLGIYVALCVIAIRPRGEVAPLRQARA